MAFTSSPTRALRTARLRVKDESGLSIVEVIVTAMIVLLTAAGTATALVTVAHTSGHQQYSSEANTLAAQDQEQLRSLSDEQLNAIQDGAVTRSHTAVLAAITFTVSSSATLTGTTSSTGCSSSAAAFYKVTSTVTWNEGTQLQSVVVNSLLTRPVIGVLVVQVTNTAGTPLQSVAVTATGPCYQTAQTNASGCALFAGLTPGNYTVSLSKSGYVDVNDKSPSTQTVAVPSAGAQVTYQLGQVSGPITGTFATPAGTTAEADGMSWSTTGMTAPGVATTTTTATTFSSPTPGNLYPGTYAVWGGQCLGQEPPSGYVTSLVVPAGGGVTGTVIEPALTVKVTYANGSVKPGHVILTFRATTGGCVDSWAPTLSTATTVPTAGWLANPGQPFWTGGTLTVCADYTTGGKTYQASVAFAASPTQTSATSTATVAMTSSSTTGLCTIQTS